MTKIEWTKRAGTKGETWNPIRARNKSTGGVGHFCTKVSAGCQNCYAADFQKRFKNTVRYAAQDADQVEIYLHEPVLMQPLLWKKPRTIFVCSMTDLFYEGHPLEWIMQIWAVMALCPQHTFQVLTKRIARASDMLGGISPKGDHAMCRAINEIPYGLGDRRGSLEMPLPNVWLGTSVEDQATANERIPVLLETPAAVRFVSAEPLLGPVDLTSLDGGYHDGVRLIIDGLTDTALDAYDNIGGIFGAKLDWVIVGGESGRNARPMHPDWARSLRDQCKAAGTPFFFKQWGAWAAQVGATYEISDDLEISKYLWKEWNGEAWEDWPHPQWCDDLDPDQSVVKVGKKTAGRLLDGVEHNEWPPIDQRKAAA
ncbi:DUF5131 family protein [Thalassospira sp. MCCC 1A01428]|uniref:DUF5131 family protein n=1 Tax=Thalassospira sp. MCCC 1A01428 TaxID=1470575 RepID=UPI000A1FDADB|nr:phage Gp37/Gp68 family protein [Thalassospira sp. MCCC 1A01428]OSQ33992.1 hypothetical protein THS27_25830 [Thalassospira sp. MCCC 1A01428]